MAGYSPLKITGTTTGLVQDREEFILPDDAYPTLQNAYVFRERIVRKKGVLNLGQLRRQVSVNGHNLTAGSFNLLSGLGLETATGSIAPGSINITGGTDLTVYTDPGGTGTLTATGGTGTGGTINYSTGVITITGGGVEAITGTIGYYPGLPVMGVRLQELQNSAVDDTIFFDQKYAYTYNGGTMQFQEFITGTTWNAAGLNTTGTNFFFSTNYWISANPPFGTSGQKLFWVTNGSGGNATPDPPRITDGSSWIDFTSGSWSQIDATTTLFNWLCMLPFRGRMVTFNTWEGLTGGGATSATQYSNRIRWADIGNPFINFAAGPPATGSWRDDVRGKGGFLDIPTSEDIVGIGFVRDNLVIYCERSTWQLRYTGRSIAPFQIERVNSEIGGLGPLAPIQFDTSLLTIGDKGITKCDSYQANRIDIKIPDFVFSFQNESPSGTITQYRVHGTRDFINRIAYWTIPVLSKYDSAIPPGRQVFPNQRLVYNYENDSWALFDDSFTAIGNFQTTSSRTWLNTDLAWIDCDFAWIDSQPAQIPIIVAGNQQGFVMQLDQNTFNDPSLFIKNITGNTTTATRITSPDHNLTTGFIIGISGIPTGTPFATSLNDKVFYIVVIDENNFDLYVYDPDDDDFDNPQLDAPGIYIGRGQINIRDNFSIISKKFNFLDEGKSIQLGYLDILMETTESTNPGAISLNVYLDYNMDEASNTSPLNQKNVYPSVTNPDTFFNSIIPTSSSSINGKGGTKFWQRVYCPTRANFLTLEYTLNNAQMVGEEQELDVQIDAQILWIRRAGRINQI